MKAAFPQISPMDLTSRLNGDLRTTVLDVRSPAEYQSGHIPGAHLLPVDELDTSRLADVIGAGLITAGITRWCGMAQLMARMPWNRRLDCGHAAQA